MRSKHHNETAFSNPGNAGFHILGLCSVKEPGNTKTSSRPGTTSRQGDVAKETTRHYVAANDAATEDRYVDCGQRRVSCRSSHCIYSAADPVRWSSRFLHLR